MDNDKWTSDAVRDAVLNNNQHLEIVLSNYFQAFVGRLGDYHISIQGFAGTDQLLQKVLEGIDSLEVLRKDFIAVVGIFAPSEHPFLGKYLPAFFEKLLNFYEENGITLYTGTNADLLRNDHYRFFNQHLFISLIALLVEYECFDTLYALFSTKFHIYYKSSGIVRSVNFMHFREYNYVLNEFLNTNQPKRISVTADYIYKYSGPAEFAKLIKTDILLYYISLWNRSDDALDPYWYPELSVYNREKYILPKLVSKSYFERAKVLFGVKTINQYKSLLDNTADPLQRGGVYRVPQLKTGLMYETVASEE
jgi:hypothetical protein